MFTHLNTGSVTSHVYHMCITISPKHIFSLFFQKSPSGPRARHVTCVSHVYHSITKTYFYSIFFKNHHRDPGPATSDLSHVYHICITCVSQYHQNTFLVYFFKNHHRDPGPATSHVYHSITKTHFYSIFFKNHHRDPGPAT